MADTTDIMTNKEIVTRLYKVLTPYRSKLVIAMVGMIIVAGFNAVQAYMVKPLLDEIFVNKDKELLNILPLALLAIFFLKGICYFIYSYLLEWVGECVIRDLRNRLYRHINRLPLTFFHHTPTGELISRIILDVTLLRGAVSHALIRILRDFVSVIGLLVVIFVMDWRLALLSLVVLPMAAVPIVVFGKKFRRVSTRYQKSVGEVTNILHETIGGTRIVKAFCMEKEEEKRFSHQIQHLFETLMKETKYRCLSHPMIEFLAGVGISLIIWFGGMQVLKGHSTMGAFMSFLTAMIMLYEPVKGVSKINSTIQSGMASATRIFNLLDVEADIEDKPDAVVLPPFNDRITFDTVGFSYEPDEKVLHDVSLTIHRGEVLAIVGPSGGGKTTLANLLPRFHDVDTGAVRIDGYDVRDVTLHSLRTQMGLVTQQTILFNDTIAYNIGYGSQLATREDIRSAAQAAFALGFIEDLPDGFDTVIGESGARLSGGQRQRISIARAILKNAPLLVLDEATSALDTESERKVQKALENLMENRTTIVIAHRLSTIKNADRIIVMQQGRLVEQGTHEQLLEKNGVYTGLHNMQYQA